MATDLPRFGYPPEQHVEPSDGLRALRDFYVDDPDDIFDARNPEPLEGADGYGVAATDESDGAPGPYYGGLDRDTDTGAGGIGKSGVQGDLPTDDQEAGGEEADSYEPADVLRVSEHLSRLDRFGANDVMLERISGALAEGRPLTDGQANFMRHEITEAELMGEGLSYEDAHEAALQTHPPGRNYDRDVIEQFEEFGPWWRRMNGLGQP